MDFKQFLNEGSKSNIKPKKYKWNELDSEKRYWDDSNYSKDQMEWISKGRGSDPEYGNIDDLDPKKYDGDQMYIIGQGRGTDTVYGNVDDLDPKLYDAIQMEVFSKGRGSDQRFGDVEHLSFKYTWRELLKFSKERGE